ncbi:MAG TPA: trypsin-like peptidase domain-containing protein [Pyrinomonadaceae bacterium]|nr:trypsin-like peptidase domain-containing protein [Pyrinomonadaceae bacterium]
MYRLTARQILSIALLSATFAAAGVACLDRFGSRLQPPTAAFSEADPSAEVAGVTDPSVATDERNNIEVFRAISPGVVSINTTTQPRGFFDPGGQGSGSGSVIDEQGHILTNNHVVDDASAVAVSFGGDKTYPARVVGRDPDTDLAVIRVENAPRELLRVVPLGDSDRLVVGQKVLAIGNPFGLDRTLTTGVISGLQRPIRAQNDRIIEGAIQTDASINPGNSGGPLLDSQGRMIGINSQILTPAGGSVGVGFAVPVNIAKRIVPQLIREGRVVRPKLGVYPRAVSDLRGLRLPVQEGLLILQLDPAGSAAQAGLRSVTQDENGDLLLGDIILSIDGEKTAEQNDLFRILDKHQFNDVVQVEVLRDGRRATLPVRLLPEPQRRGIFRRQ